MRSCSAVFTYALLPKEGRIVSDVGQHLAHSLEVLDRVPRREHNARQGLHSCAVEGRLVQHLPLVTLLVEVGQSSVLRVSGHD